MTIGTLLLLALTAGFLLGFGNRVYTLLPLLCALIAAGVIFYSTENWTSVQAVFRTVMLAVSLQLGYFAALVVQAAVLRHRR